MKRKQENKNKLKNNIKIEKRNASLFIKIYDLYIQRTDAFYILKREDKYLFYKLERIFDIIKSNNLYPRLLKFPFLDKIDLHKSNVISFSIDSKEEPSLIQKQNKKNSDYQIKKMDKEKYLKDLSKKKNVIHSENVEVEKDVKTAENKLDIIPNEDEEIEESKNIENVIEQKNLNNISDNNIATNINRKLKRKVYLGQDLTTEDVTKIKIIGDGNCFYRCISYFFLNNQEFYIDIKNMVINWIDNNYETFLEFFGDDDINHLSRELQAKLEFNYIKNKDSWGSHYTISICCLLFNIDIAVYVKGPEGNYKQYNLFTNDDTNLNSELCILNYHNNNHFDILYSKDELENHKFLVKSLIDIKVKDKINIKDIKIEGKEFNNKYVETTLKPSKNLYDEIALFLFSIMEHKEEIEKLKLQNPQWHYNQILSKFKLKYPKRLEGNTIATQEKKKFLENV